MMDIFKYKKTYTMLNCTKKLGLKHHNNKLLLIKLVSSMPFIIIKYKRFTKNTYSYQLYAYNVYLK